GGAPPPLPVFEKLSRRVGLCPSARAGRARSAARSRPAASLLFELPAALRRAGADPLDGRQQRLSRIPDELRLAGELPRRRRRLLAGALAARPVRVGAGGVRAAGLVRARVPGVAGQAGGAAPAGGRLRASPASTLAQPGGHLPPRGRADGD